MTTTTSIHSGSTPPAPPTIGTGVRGFQVLPREQTRPGAAPAGSAGRPPGRRSSERERPEDDEVVLTYTSESACRRVS